MAWLKQWDFCVFGKKKGKKRPRDDDATFNADDEYHRPKEKVILVILRIYNLLKKLSQLLLISGPPGLGKTTMVHVIAQQAGYQVLEINARFVVNFASVFMLLRLLSDARSAQVVDDRIRPALESGSAIGSSKPVLIIIDEIDGATGGGDNVRIGYMLYCSASNLRFSPVALCTDYCSSHMINLEKRVSWLFFTSSSLASKHT